MKAIATYSIKGGVGKTTTAVNVAYEAARSGARVLLWDLDPQGAATFFFRVRPLVKGGVEGLVDGEDGLAHHVRATDHAALHLVPADFSLRHLDLHLEGTKRPTERLGTLLEPLDDRYDLAVLDCPPGITLTSESVFGAVDALLVPTIPTTLSQRTLDQLAQFLDDQRDPPRVWPFVSMVDRRKVMQRTIAAELAATAAGFLPTTIPNASIVERMGLERAPLGTFAPRTAAALAYRDLWRDLAERLWS